MDNNKDNKNDSPAVPKAQKSNISVQRSKSETKAKTKNSSPPSESQTKRTILSSFGNWKKSASEKGPKRGATSKDSGLTIEPTINKTQADTNVNATPNYDNFELPVEELPSVTAPHAEEYFMGHKKRGKAIIFNHKHFEKEDTRNGTDIDVEKLISVFTKLKFEVEVYTDLEYSDVLDTVKRLSKLDYSDCDCIAFFILTHGNKHRELSAKDVYYSADKIWEKFAGDQCPSLAGKPKLFFINACRGRKKDSGIRFFRSNRTEADSSAKQTFKIPNFADFLIAYSTVDGFLSYREAECGSWFIQCLCEVFLEYHTTKDLLKMLTITARKVALDYRTIADVKEDHDLTQVPSITTMLIRDVFLRVD